MIDSVTKEKYLHGDVFTRKPKEVLIIHNKLVDLGFERTKIKSTDVYLNRRNNKWIAAFMINYEEFTEDHITDLAESCLR